jgi:hypothetical protein
MGGVTRTAFGHSQLDVQVLAHAAVAARHVWNGFLSEDAERAV